MHRQRGGGLCLHAAVWGHAACCVYRWRSGRAGDGQLTERTKQTIVVVGHRALHLLHGRHHVVQFRVMAC